MPIEVRTAHSKELNQIAPKVTYCKLDIDIRKNEPKIIRKYQGKSKASVLWCVSVHSQPVLFAHPCFSFSCSCTVLRHHSSPPSFTVVLLHHCPSPPPFTPVLHAQNTRPRPTHPPRQHPWSNNHRPQKAPLTLRPATSPHPRGLGSGRKSPSSSKAIGNHTAVTSNDIFRRWP